MTRILVPDDPAASDYITTVEKLVQELGHQCVVRPLTRGWVVVVHGPGSNTDLADAYGPPVYLFGRDLGVRHDPIP